MFVIVALHVTLMLGGLIQSRAFEIMLRETYTGNRTKFGFSRLWFSRWTRNFIYPVIL